MPRPRNPIRAHDAWRRGASKLRGGNGCLLCLLNRGEFGASPLRVDDELERIELLVLLPQPVKSLTAQMRQGLARRVGAEPEVSELECEGMIPPIQQALST